MQLLDTGTSPPNVLPSKARYRIELLAKDHKKDGFACEEESLNRFLFSFAGQHSKKDISKTYVAVDISSEQVVGYYTLVNSSLELEILPEYAAKGYPSQYAVPAIKLARLARDLSTKGDGLGEILLMSAYARAVEIADISGAAVLELDAMNPSVRDKFYAKFGFKQLVDDDLHLYISMKTVRKVVKLLD